MRTGIMPLRQESLVARVNPRAMQDRRTVVPPETKMTGGKGASAGDSRDPPGFHVGEWRFRVRSGDPGLLEELEMLCRLLFSSPRPEVDFTVRLIRYTEEGRLGGWAWTRERIAGT